MADRSFDKRRIPGAGLIAALAFAVLYIPLVILVTYSFNAGSRIGKWEGFSLHWYGVAFRNEDIQSATLLSVKVAVIAALVATVCATLVALATTRGQGFKAGRFVQLAVNQPLMVPEIVTAMALLILFAVIKDATGYSGTGYLIAAHSAFCIPFAFMPVRARLQDMDTNLEAAAADLYANAWVTFRRVTLPLLWPAVLAGFMLAFVISLDDVLISEFIKTAGQETLPTYLLGQLRRGITADVYAVSTILLAVSTAIVTLIFVINRKKKPGL